jgi:hypothetical protein
VAGGGGSVQIGVFAAELFQNAVVRNGLTDERCRVRHWAPMSGGCCFDLSNALNAKPIVVQLDAVPVTRERDAVETAARLESRITSLLAMFRPAKERLVCFMHTAKDVLAAGEIRQPEVPSSTNLFQLIRLRVVVDRNSLLPRIATFLQCGVVQTACFTQLHIQQFAFEAGRE